RGGAAQLGYLRPQRHDLTVQRVVASWLAIGSRHSEPWYHLVSRRIVVSLKWGLPRRSLFAEAHVASAGSSAASIERRRCPISPLLEVGLKASLGGDGQATRPVFAQEFLDRRAQRFTVLGLRAAVDVRRQVRQIADVVSHAERAVHLGARECGEVAIARA